MTTFTFTPELEAVCQSTHNGQGFRHQAVLHRDNKPGLKVYVQYINRTWETYTYHTVLDKLLDRAETLGLMTTDELEIARKAVG